MAQTINHVEKEFIFDTTREDESEFVIVSDVRRISSTLASQSEEFLQFRCEETFPERSNVSVYFRFRGHPMTFKTRVRKSTPGSLTLRQPRVLYRDLSRRYERIETPAGIGVSFLHKGRRVSLAFPESTRYVEVETPNTVKDFDASRLQALLESFRVDAQQHATEAKIVMFRARSPSSPQEKIVARTGKVLMLPFYSGKPDELSELASENLLSAAEITEDADALEKAVAGLKSQGLHHEMYCPIMYLQYVVGYLYFIKTGRDTAGFDTAAVEFALQMAHVFAYSLKANGYFASDESVPEYLTTDLIDISATGILFSCPTEEVDLSLYTDIEIMLSIDEAGVPIIGRVVRKFADETRTFYGVNFLRIAEPDRDRLVERLYGKDSTSGFLVPTADEGATSPE